MMKRLIYISMMSGMVAACTPAPKEAYFNRGDPESLLDFSSEVVSVRITSPTSVQKVIDAVNKEQPTRAVVTCQEASPLCKEVKSVMQQFGIAAKYNESNANNVALVYERVLARDCQNRYIDLLSNMNNLNSPSLGCSTAVNIVQMVTDKRQFTNPALMDTPGAAKGMQALENYETLTKPDTTFSTLVEGSGGGASR